MLGRRSLLSLLRGSTFCTVSVICKKSPITRTSHENIGNRGSRPVPISNFADNFLSKIGQTIILVGRTGTNGRCLLFLEKIRTWRCRPCRSASVLHAVARILKQFSVCLIFRPSSRVFLDLNYLFTFK